MEQSYKRFIPCMYLKDGIATDGFDSHNTVSGDPVKLSLLYEKKGADALIVFDQSVSDDEHVKALGIIEDICRKSGLPIIAAGHINTEEDIENLLEIGCRMAAVNFSRKDNIELISRVSGRIKKDRLAVCYRAADDIKANEKLICSSVGRLILIDDEQTRQALTIKDVPSILMLSDVSLDKILEFFTMDNVSGISGKAVNDNVDQIKDLKLLAAENGISVDIGNKFTKKAVFGEFKKDILGKILKENYEKITEIRDNPDDDSYTGYLFKSGLNRTLKKLGENNTQIVIAAKENDRSEIIDGISDYIYHLMVLMAQNDIDWNDIEEEFRKRQKKQEKYQGKSLDT